MWFLFRYKLRFKRNLISLPNWIFLSDEKCLSAPAVTRPAIDVWSLYPVKNLTISGVEFIWEPLIAYFRLAASITWVLLFQHLLNERGNHLSVVVSWLACSTNWNSKSINFFSILIWRDMCHTLLWDLPWIQKYK